VRALGATRFADDPEFTSDADSTPTNRASLRSNSLAKRPVVNQPSRAESTTEQTSSGPMTLPDTGTGDSPETNSRLGKASTWYSAVSAKICFRNCSARSVIDIRILKVRATAFEVIPAKSLPFSSDVFWGRVQRDARKHGP